MKKVTQEKLQKVLTLLAVGCTVVGAMLNIYTKDYWTALTFASAAIVFTVTYLSQLEEGKEDSDDEQ
jgi:hypothetical protein